MNETCLYRAQLIFSTIIFYQYEFFCHGSPKTYDTPTYTIYLGRLIT
jgi:hypothetical protein